MRLTVRTLLAYMDRVLEPVDSDALEAKIRTSQLARTLIERIHAALSQRRLSAPPLDGRGLGGDPNTVAEYLDNTLEADRVPEFERICLESDVQLAEVAGCHQILSLASGKSTNLSPGLRERIYGFQERPDSKPFGTLKTLPGNGDVQPFKDENSGFESSHVDRVSDQSRLTSTHSKMDDRVKRRTDQTHQVKALSAPGSDLVGLSPTPSRSTEVKTFTESKNAAAAPLIRGRGIDLANDKLACQVPEYLRGKKRHVWSQSWVSMGLLVLLVFFSWQAIGSMNRVRGLLSHSSTSVDGRRATQAERWMSEGNSNDERQAQPAEQNPMGKLDQVSDSASRPNSSQASPLTSGQPKLEDVEAAELEANSKTPADHGASLTGVSAPRPDLTTDPRGGVAETEKLGPNGRRSAETSSIAARPKPGIEAESSVHSMTSPGQWLPADRSESECVIFTLEQVAGGPPRVARLNPGQILEYSRRMIIPPYYRTQFLIGPGLKWTVAGPSNLAVLKPKASDVASVSMRLGRAILRASPECRAARLEWQDQWLDIRFEDAESACSVELSYAHPPGVDLSEPSALLPTFQLIGIHGDLAVTLSESGQSNATLAGQSLRVSPKQAFTWVRGQEFVIRSLTQNPGWHETSIERPIDRFAARDLYRYMANAESSELFPELVSLTTEKRSETAALATLTLMLLGDFTSLFGQEEGKEGLLNRAAARGHWNSVLDRMWDALGSHPNGSPLLQTALDAKAPMRGAGLRNLLVGFSASRLIAGGDKLLVESLASRQLDERVIAAYQLRAITGKDHGFVADQPNPDSLLLWRKELANGKIRISSQ